MQFITLKNYRCMIKDSEPNYIKKYDVIVIGLGTAGTEAAMLCAKLKLKTLGIERMNGMGGQFTFGGMSGNFTNFNGGWGNQTEGHVQEVSECEKYGISAIPSRLYAYEVMSDEYNLDTLYEASVIGIYKKDGVIDGVRVVCNGEIYEYSADMFIDCTTHAVVCRMFGCEISHGREDGGQMAYSKVIRHVDKNGAAKGNWATINTMTKPSAKEYSDKVLQMSCVYPCSWEDDRLRIIQEANILGSREDGHVVTEDTVTFRDCLENRQVDRPIFYTMIPCDMVRPDRDFSLESDEFIKFRVISGVNYCRLSIGVPFGSIIPKNSRHLLVASKCFGAAHDASSGLRMCTTLKKCGEASAYTAFLAKKYNVDVRDIPYKELKEWMMSTEGFCDHYNVGIIDVGVNKGKEIPVGIDWYNKEQVVNALQRDIVQDDDLIGASNARIKSYKKEENVPGIAYLTMLMLYKKSDKEKKVYTDYIYNEMKKSSRYAGNLAIALGLAGDERCSEVLLSIIKNPGNSNPDGYDPVIENTIPNRVKALYLLGQLKEVRAIEPIIDIIEDYAESYTRDLPLYRLFNTRDSYKYQSLAYAITALYRLLSNNPKQEYIERIKKWRKQPFEIYASTSTRNLSEVLFYTADKIVNLD